MKVWRGPECALFTTTRLKQLHWPVADSSCCCGVKYKRYVPTATSSAAEIQLPPFLFRVLFYKPVLTQLFIPSPIYSMSLRLFL